MSSDAIAFAALCVSLIAALVVFVRDSAVKNTAHDYRLKSLEKTREEDKADHESAVASLKEGDRALAVHHRAAH